MVEGDTLEVYATGMSVVCNTWVSAWWNDSTGKGEGKAEGEQGRLIISNLPQPGDSTKEEERVSLQ